jgi:Fe-S-cluster formation regulator IscX/YfhJ
MDLITKTLNIMEDENTENIDPKEKETIVNDLRIWILQLDDFNDIDMLYQLSDMMSEWEDGVDWDKIELD